MGVAYLQGAGDDGKSVNRIKINPLVHRDFDEQFGANKSRFGEYIRGAGDSQKSQNLTHKN